MYWYMDLYVVENDIVYNMYVVHDEYNDVFSQTCFYFTHMKGTAFQRFYHPNYCIIIRVLVDTWFSVSFANFGCA